jgi:hypothetical protein
VACAPALESYEMMPKAAVYDTLPDNNTFAKNIAVTNVIADDGMGGATAPITSENYKQAIVSALRQAGWYNNGDNARFHLEAHLVEVDQPMVGFSFTVKTRASYVLTENKTGKVFYNDTITMPCTVTMSEALVGEVRLRKATSCAVGENITHLLKVIAEQ